MSAISHLSVLELALAVSACGGAGALCRTLVNDAIAHRVRSDFPFGILSINVAGSFLLGLITGLYWYHGLSFDQFTMASVGMCGGFTTWSTSIWETLALLRLRLPGQAVAYTLGGLGLAVGAAALGIGVAAVV
jgi:fluoride exporter